MALSGACKNRGEVRIHESLDELSTDLADYIAELSEASVKERGVFAIALSGGSLVGLMRKLCDAPYNKTVDWAKWYIFWADERVVAKTHADSNYKLAKDGLLSKVFTSYFIYSCVFFHFTYLYVGCVRFSERLEREESKCSWLPSLSTACLLFRHLRCFFGKK
ncbi:hypothetical protein F2P56_035995, partial [Juglans regia]